MVTVPVSLPAARLSVGICQMCEFFWFAAGEFEKLPVLPPPPPKKADPVPVPLEVSEALLRMSAQELGAQARERESMDEAEDGWKGALFGLPVEIGNAVRQPAWATWTLAAVTTLVSLATFADLDRAAADYGLIPSQAGRLGGLTWVTSFFLHGSIAHLLGNMYFLLVFGDNVEEYVGHWRFLLLIAASAFIGDVLHVAFDPRANVPAIGASGAISGVIVFYALQFPDARLAFRLFRFSYSRVTISARTAIIGWVALQSLGALQEMEGLSHVSSLGHLGGAATGFVFWLLLGGRSASLPTPAHSDASPP
jgi:membrane associated rhomboid family serine protease